MADPLFEKTITLEPYSGGATVCRVSLRNAKGQWAVSFVLSSNRDEATEQCDAVQELLDEVYLRVDLRDDDEPGRPA